MQSKNLLMKCSQQDINPRGGQNKTTSHVKMGCLVESSGSDKVYNKWFHLDSILQWIICVYPGALWSCPYLQLQTWDVNPCPLTVV